MITDFHTHILPGVDDGSDSVAQSLRMLQMLKEQNITRVVATPHFYAAYDHPQRFLERRQHALEELLAAESEDLPQIVLAAEIRYFDGISDCDELEALTIQGTRCILVEMPGTSWNDRMYRELQELRQKRGITPIMAHVDRYLTPLNANATIERLDDLPVLLQMNANFFLRKFTRPMAMKMLKDGKIHCIGSDCHNTVSRRPNMGDALAAIKKSLGYGVIEDLKQWETRIFTNN